MQYLIFSLILKLKNLKDITFSPSKNQYKFQKVPHFVQVISDSKNKKIQKLWTENGCGMACLKMILTYKTGKAYPLYKLGQESMKYGCYIVNPKSPGGMDGLFYIPFINFIKKEFNLEGKVLSFLTIADIVRSLSNKQFVIASVSPEISTRVKKPKRNNGHLILLTGYNWSKKTLIFNNTVDKKREQEKIHFQDFEKYFAFKGIQVF